MERITISDAIDVLDELLQALTDAYWDANDLAQKDTLFDAVSTVNYERNELSKLSVNDFSLRYEPVTSQFLNCSPKLKRLQNKTDDWFPRTRTAESLHAALTRALNLVSTKRM